MPRHYIRKTTRGMGYTVEALRSAIQHVQSGRLSAHGASKMFNIPVSTLHTRLHKPNPFKNSLGRAPALPTKIEKRLANAISMLHTWGFRLSKQEMTHIVAEFIKFNKLCVTTFKNNVPGSDWLVNFCKRHLLATCDKDQVRTGDPFVIFEYFTLLKSGLQKLGLNDSPHQIWNLTETSMELLSSQNTVETNVTVLTAVNARGEKILPFITFDRKQNWIEWMVVKSSSNTDGESYEVSDKGCTKTNILHSYMSKLFVPNVGSDRPILILYDGKNSLIDVKAVEFADHNNIIILKLPSQMSTRLQPLDFVFESLWEDKFTEWQQKNFDTRLTKNVFLELIVDIWSETTTEIIRDGFKTAGIHPYNSDVVPIGEYDENAYKKWCDNKTESEIVGNVDPLSASEVKRLNSSYPLLAEALSPESQESSTNFSNFCVKEELILQFEEFLD